MNKTLEIILSIATMVVGGIVFITNNNLLGAMGIFIFLAGMISFMTQLENKCSHKTSGVNCIHNWEEHGCTPSIKKYYICTKCGGERF